MQVKYQDIRVNREYIVYGNAAYYHYPRLVVKVLEQPPQYQAVGNFYPSIRVRILQTLPNPHPNPEFPVNLPPIGSEYVLNWRSNLWGQPWNDWGSNWLFRNVVLNPLPANVQAKDQALKELKAIPANPPNYPGFPGGTDFLALASQQLRHQPIPLARNLEGGTTFYEPIYT